MSKDIIGRELIVIAKTDADKYGNARVVRVVQWIIDGEPKSIKLEKRMFFRNKEGEERSKPDGFTLIDLKEIQPRWRDIIEMMRNPPKYDSHATEETNGIEEVPF